MSSTSAGTTLRRALRLRCPRCGEGPLFAGWFRMHERCDRCGLKFERAPGYFLGSVYVSYGVTSLSLTFGYVLLHFVAGYSNRALFVPLVAWFVGVPLLGFRHARSLWLGFDYVCDPVNFESDDPRRDE